MSYPFILKYDENDYDYEDNSSYNRTVLALALVILLIALLTLGAPRTVKGVQPVILLTEIRPANDDAGVIEQYIPVAVWLPEPALYSCFVGSSQCCVVSDTPNGAVITSETTPDACSRVAQAIPLLPYASDASVTAGEGE